jgi:hypothetical protein
MSQRTSTKTGACPRNGKWSSIQLFTGIPHPALEAGYCRQGKAAVSPCSSWPFKKAGTRRHAAVGGIYGLELPGWAVENSYCEVCLDPGGLTPIDTRRRSCQVLSWQWVRLARSKLLCLELGTKVPLLNGHDAGTVVRLTLERTFEGSTPAFKTALTGVEHSLRNAARKASFFSRVI